MLCDLVVDDCIDNAASDISTLLGADEFLVGQSVDGVPRWLVAQRDDLCELVVDQEKDEGNGLDCLREQALQLCDRGVLNLFEVAVRSVC